MFRKLLALEVAALKSSEETSFRPERVEMDPLAGFYELLKPCTGDFGNMWSSLRSIG